MANSHQHQSSFEVWDSFFRSAGIPSSVSHDYAMKFSQHRIRIDMLQEISKEILLDMGIKAMGDIIAILRHAKSICAQNELKPTGLAKSLSNHLVSPTTTINNNSNNFHHHHPPTAKNLTQRMPISSGQASLQLAPATSGATTGNKIQSRLNLRSGAVIASVNNGFGADSTSRTGSTISSSLAKRLAPPPGERKPILDLTEKTLTVHYPSRAAIEKAAQRISGPDTKNHHSVATTSSSIKSRLGSIRSNDGGKFESNSGNTIKIRNSNPINKHIRSSSSLRTSNRDIVPVSRRLETRRSDERNPRGGDRHSSNNRPKSTVFSRLGQSAR